MWQLLIGRASRGRRPMGGRQRGRGLCSRPRPSLMAAGSGRLPGRGGAGAGAGAAPGPIPPSCVAPGTAPAGTGGRGGSPLPSPLSVSEVFADVMGVQQPRRGRHVCIAQCRRGGGTCPAPVARQRSARSLQARLLHSPQPRMLAHRPSRSGPAAVRCSPGSAPNPGAG